MAIPKEIVVIRAVISAMIYPCLEVSDDSEPVIMVGFWFTWCRNNSLSEADTKLTENGLLGYCSFILFDLASDHLIVCVSPLHGA